MNVILLEKIRNLGDIGDQVSVKAGHARNFLIPTGKAVFATKSNIEQFEERRAELESKAKALKEAAEARASKLVDTVLNLHARASDEGKLFGSIGVREIVSAFSAAGHEIEKSEIQLPEGPVRNTGEYDISVQLHSEVAISIKLVVAPEA